MVTICQVNTRTLLLDLISSTTGFSFWGEWFECWANLRDLSIDCYFIYDYLDSEHITLGSELTKIMPGYPGYHSMIPL